MVRFWNRSREKASPPGEQIATRRGSDASPKGVETKGGAIKSMSGSAHGFRTGRPNVYQTLLSKPDHGESGLPLMRADWFA